MFSGAASGLDDITKVIVKHNVDSHNVLHRFELPPAVQRNLDSLASSFETLARSVGASIKIVAVGVLAYCALKGVSLVISYKVTHSIGGGADSGAGSSSNTNHNNNSSNTADK